MTILSGSEGRNIVVPVPPLANKNIIKSESNKPIKNNSNSSNSKSRYSNLSPLQVEDKENSNSSSATSINESKSKQNKSSKVNNEQIQQPKTPSKPPLPKSSDRRRLKTPNGVKKKDIWQRLNHLKHLKHRGVISETEYAVRKQQLVDEMTGTTLKRADDNKNNMRKGKKKKSRGSKRKKAIRWEFHNGFYMGKPSSAAQQIKPDFSQIPIENAICYTFDVNRSCWTQSKAKVKLAREPFGRGSLRLAYHMLLVNTEKGNMENERFVAKISIDPYEERDSYFRDVSMQMYTREYASKYNSYDPPKKIHFIKAWILELVDRPARPVCAVERFIVGPYRKHNNNFGYVNDTDRNTPQAFSHFTYEASKKKLLVCDVQGVGDLYTDPQIHSKDGIGFGKGNMGQRGIAKFISSHRCNAICQYLKLPEINAKTLVNEVGTLPNVPHMNSNQVDYIDLDLNDAAADRLLGKIVKRPQYGAAKPTQLMPEKWCDCKCTIL